MKFFLILAATLILTGWVLIGEGSNLPLYRDEEEFQRRTEQINPEWSNASGLYRELRQEFLTHHIAYHDYGATLIVVGLLLPMLPAATNYLVRTQMKQTTLFLLGAGSASVTVAAELVSLFLDAARGAFPWFADAIAIPIAGAPVVSLVLLAWVGVHVGWRRLALRCPCGPAHRSLRAWSKIVTGLAGILLMLILAKGEFLFVVPNLLWLAFYDLLRRGLPVTGSAF